ncbi:PREDICTED: heterogeneous nuclear ribonucleoprotein 1-like [Lupinus angustifolius]|uniref:heterogeneous nuclear ribonucleoprotein 1-like n=1 Tax=Lupinus angustifolius TaxID=3871 RepID=UPI00092EC9C3|nr:PREDICTED: heterogeneous nuclear ribonucleoprotein 1-like [Lupinus angustifolius]
MDSDKAKLFVGGISRETTDDILRNHFARYGNVLDSTISVDRITRNPRGFGFVTFSDLSAAVKALQDTHVVLGRTVEVKRAIPRSEQQHQNQMQNRVASNYCSNECSGDQIRTKKIFVGGLSSSISEEEFRRYFERFGRITDVVVMQDSVTHRPRGFGFITFDSEKSVENAVVQSFHDLNGRQVEVKRAVPKEGNYGGDGFSKSRHNKIERGPSQIYPPYSPRYMFPGSAPLSYYSSGGVYAYGSNPYGYCYTMGGYGVNGFAVPSDASRNFWYGPMVTGPQACQMPYVNASPNVAYTGGRVQIVGSCFGTRGYNGVLGPATNLKSDQCYTANGFIPHYVTPPHS